MVDVDSGTERRNGCLQLAIQLVLLGVVLYLVTPDKVIFLALLGPLLGVLAYRGWAVERFSPTLAQSYARAVVGGSADAIVAALRTTPYLADSWRREGTDVDGLTALPPDRLAGAMRQLRSARYPTRRLVPPWHAVNRAAAATLGAVLGGALGWSALRATVGCGVPAPGTLVHALPWPVWAGLAMVVVSRIGIAVYNRQRRALVAASMRGGAATELDALLNPPWTGRRRATVADLNKLVGYAGGRPAPEAPGELAMVSLHLSIGILAGLVGALVTQAC